TTAEHMAALWKEVAREHAARSSSARQHARACHDSMDAAVRRANKAEFDAATCRADRDAAEEERDEAARERDRWHSMWRQRGIKHLAAEKRATRAEAQAAIRGRAVAIYQQRAREAEAWWDRWHSMWRQRGVKHLAAEKRATRAEAERDGWRQTALDERGAALDALEQIKVRDARIKAVQDLIDQVKRAAAKAAWDEAIEEALDGWTIPASGDTEAVRYILLSTNPYIPEEAA